MCIITIRMKKDLTQNTSENWIDSASSILMCNTQFLILYSSDVTFLFDKKK